ncbi:hypothetical protein PIB30_075437, partial [Stylosanthes scabra]|nr:hypothetical protein [Stylosanthes scabra]
ASWQQATTHDPRLSHSCVAPNFTRLMHMRGGPRICVESSTSRLRLTFGQASNMTLCAEPPQTHACAWKITHVTFKAHVQQSKRDLFILPCPKSHAYAQNSKHMRGKLRSSFKLQDPRICVEDQVYAWRILKNNSTFKAKMKTHA